MAAVEIPFMHKLKANHSSGFGGIRHNYRPACHY
jgi:hypothetical protein